MIDFTESGLKARQKKAFLHEIKMSRNNSRPSKMNSKNTSWRFIFRFLLFIEVLLQENFDQAYLNAITDKLQNFL